MGYQFPTLWNACVAEKWCNPQTCSPSEFYTCVVRAEQSHAGKGRVDKYAKKAFKKISQKRFNGSTLPPLKSQLSQIATKNQTILTAENARLAQAENAKIQREAEINNLRAQLSNVQTALEATSAKVATCTSSLKEYQDRVKDLTEKLSKEREIKQSLETRIDELARQLETSQNNVSELAKAFGEARRESSTSRKRTEELESYLNKMSAEIANLNEKSMNHSEEVERLRQSQTTINNLLLQFLNNS